MKNLHAFMKKEWMEQIRSGRITILCILFVFIGIMNPAIAKMTPWLCQMFSDSLAQNGITVTAVPADAMTSWTQFFKNIPVGLLVFLLLQSSIFTKEYQTGSLILTMARGLERYKVVVAKTLILLTVWTVDYWICYAITYGYNAFFWDNAVARHLMFAGMCWWLFGVWSVILISFFSTVCNTNSTVLIGTATVLFFLYLIGLVPMLKEYSPLFVLNSNALLTGAENTILYSKAIMITIGLCVSFLVLSMVMMNRKQL